MNERSHKSKLKMETPARYRILVQGCLDERWSDRMSGLKITIDNPKEGPVVTQLSGEVMDQAALLGVINALYNFRYPLLSVEYQMPGDEEK